MKTTTPAPGPKNDPQVSPIDLMLFDERVPPEQPETGVTEIRAGVYIFPNDDQGTEYDAKSPSPS